MSEAQWQPFIQIWSLNERKYKGNIVTMCITEIFHMSFKSFCLAVKYKIASIKTSQTHQPFKMKPNAYIVSVMRSNVPDFSCTMEKSSLFEMWMPVGLWPCSPGSLVVSSKNAKINTFQAEMLTCHAYIHCQDAHNQWYPSSCIWGISL